MRVLRTVVRLSRLLPGLPKKGAKHEAMLFQSSSIIRNAASQLWSIRPLLRCLKLLHARLKSIDYSIALDIDESLYGMCIVAGVVVDVGTSISLEQGLMFVLTNLGIGGRSEYCFLQEKSTRSEAPNFESCFVFNFGSDAWRGGTCSPKRNCTRETKRRNHKPSCFKFQRIQVKASAILHCTLTTRTGDRQRTGS